MDKDITIRDAILGDIKINDTERKIIDDPHFQRLRYIRQVGFLYLTYPGANHTRFEHSIGTMKVTKDICEALGIENAELVVSGLLHDIGHAPFSHQSEDIMKRYLHKDHEQVGAEIISKSSIRDKISDSNLSYKKLISYIKGAHPSEIICGAVGSDRIDYLVRDSYYTGTAYGMIETDRIKGKMAISGGHLGIKESGLQVAESILIARYYMFISAYTHHTTIIAGGMFDRALDLAIGAGEIDPKSILNESDYSIMARLAASETEASKISKRITERRLLKRIYYKPIHENDLAEKVREKVSTLDIDQDNTIIRAIKLKGGSDDIDIIDKNRKISGKLSEKSELFAKLSETMRNRTMLLVAAEEKDRKKVEAATSKILGA